MQELVERVVLDALRLSNASRPPDRQLRVASDAALYDGGDQLNSLDLVALVLDIEDGLRAMGHPLSLSDAHALSLRHSPFRNVPTLVSYVVERLGTPGCRTNATS